MDFSCPHCGQALSIPDLRRGALVRCPICRGEYRATEQLRDRSSPMAAVAPPRPQPQATRPPVIVADPLGPGGRRKSNQGSGWGRALKAIFFIVMVVLVKGGHLLFRDRPKAPPPRPVHVPLQPFPNQGPPPGWIPPPMGAEQPRLPQRERPDLEEPLPKLDDVPPQR